MRAKIRKDLIEQELLPSVRIIDQNGCWVDIHLPKELLDKEFESFQPEAWNDNEYNTVIVNNHCSYLINSIELDFIHEPKTYSMTVSRVETKSTMMNVWANDPDEAKAKLLHQANQLKWNNFPMTKVEFIIK